MKLNLGLATHTNLRGDENSVNFEARKKSEKIATLFKNSLIYLQTPQINLKE